ncbi:MAG TPA: hypothetical protein VEU95_12200, partial [Micropepsaceae bacterium]|nr:hypothetical protein [Micropepsaceae bacterium]
VLCALFCFMALSGSEAAARNTAALHVGSMIAFYVPWDGEARADLTSHAGDLGIFSPQWISLKASDGTLTVLPDDATVTALSQFPQPPLVMPLVTNAHDGIWDAAAAEAAITKPDAWRAVLGALVELATQRGFRGYVFDFENLSPAAVTALPGFLQDARAAFSPGHIEAMIAVPLGSADWPLKALQDTGATVVLMAYDECWAGSTPGPIAGEDWFLMTLSSRLSGLDPAKVIVALGSYAYDWPKGQRAAVLSVAQANALAQSSGATIASTAPVLNPAFAYEAPDGVPHTVWMLDAPTFAAERAIALRSHVKGVALWRLGLEDPAIWARGEHLTPRRHPVPANTGPVCTPLP